MAEHWLARALPDALERFESLRTRSRDDVSSELDDAMAEGIAELGTAIEELRVAEEELRAQSEQLAASEALAVAERDRYRDLFETAPDGYLVTDPNGVILEANHAARLLLGANARGVIGRPLSLFVAPEDRFEHHLSLGRLRRGQSGSAQTLRLRPAAPGEDPVVVDLTVASHRGAKGDWLVRWQFRDVTALWRSHRDLERSHAELESRVRARTIDLERSLTERTDSEERSGFLAASGALLASSLDGKATLDHIGGLVVPLRGDGCLIELFESDGTWRRIDVASDGLAARFFEACGEDHGRHDPDCGPPEHDLFVADLTEPPDDLTDPERAWLQCYVKLGWRSLARLVLFAQGRTFGALCVGSRRAGAWHAADRFTLEGLARQAAVTLHNVTLVEQLRVADRRKEVFLATLAHELRGPLGAIVTALDLMAPGVGVDLEWVRGLLGRQVGHIRRLVDDLSDASRIARGQVEIQRTAIDLGETAAAAVESNTAAIRAAGLDLEFHRPGRPVPVLGDSTRLAQVASNLIHNAIKYSPQGGKLAVGVAIDGRSALLTVRDEGTGIAPEMLPNIFELFAQEERSRDYSQGGLGIGLAVVKQLVNLHGGTVAVASAGPGQGSEFTVRLPLGDYSDTSPSEPAAIANSSASSGDEAEGENPNLERVSGA